MVAQLAKKIAAVAFSVALALGFVPLAASQSAYADGGSAPTVDGDLSEWSGIAKQTSTDSDIDYWQVAKDSDGNVYLAVSGTASTQWVSWDWGNNQETKQIGSTINGSHQTTAFAALKESWATLKGSYKQVNKANGNTAGPMYVEVKIDASSFKGTSDYSLSFAGTTVSASDIPAFSGSSSPDTPATYNGIAIDGKFSDWAAVSKTETSDPNSAHPNNLAAEAMVFDGDYVYIYIEEGKGGSAADAGTHTNGQFAITTDLGNTLLVQLTADNQGNSSVTAGGTQVQSSHVGTQWEIAVPKSLLPSYQKTLSFGLYLEDPTVKDVANLDTSDNGNSGNFGGITYDGDYSDWKAYPHTEIQYATSGTQEHVEDATGALYSSNGTLYTHVKTTMPAHLQEKGGEFLAAVTYDFGDGRYYTPNFATVDSSGNISWYSGGTELSPGTHEFYMFSTDGWNNSTNVNNLTAGDHVYGKVTVTVGADGSVDEMESEIDLSALAQKFNCSADDFKTIKAQFGRLGQQWLETAGTPTGPWLGTGIAIASVIVVVGGYALYRRRKQGGRDASADGAGSAAGAGSANAAVAAREQAR